MHLRISRTKRDGRVYEYAQLVQSVRRPDGMPVHRVVATLGALSSIEIENLRAALAASRDGKRVVTIAPYARAGVAPDVLANLRYLDIAVGLELWREWGLDELLSSLLPPGESDVLPADVVATFVLQRLVDPGSKLAATEWIHRTALPELLDLAPKQFNNTRGHRVLDALDSVGNELMARLPRRYEDKDGAFASLFLDVSDAAFIGHGPPLAEKAKTKEGFVARKVGIVLLCNERGYPVRWQVVPGAAPDCKTMLAMLESVSGLRWLGEAPVVCDRAMGRTATILAMAQLKLRFLTALTRTEFASYSTNRLPCDALADLNPSSACDAKVETEAVRRVVAAGMEQVDDTLFVLDLGVVERSTDAPTVATQAATPSQAMKVCRQMLDLVASDECPSFESARRRVGLGKGVATKYRGLQKLCEDIQRDVIAGRAEDCSLDALLRLARLDREAQRQHFDELVAKEGPRKRAAAESVEQTPVPVVPTVKLRVVAYFNQERFVEQRHHANGELVEIREFVADLNRRLARAPRRRTRASIEAEVDRKLRAHDLLEAFELTLHEEKLAGRSGYRVELQLDESDWARRRRYDGFTLLVGHGDLPHNAAQMCRLYRAKDLVEKDFHIIKSVVEVRPVWHHTDAKVRAHVTLCMLALLLERTLQQRLRGKCSPEVALERLEPCRLNQFDSATRAYALTRPTAEQKDILRALDLMRLVDDEAVAERLRPRSS
jgi:transposase